jgi:hypothetical protein
MFKYETLDLDKLIDLLAEQTTTFTLLRSLKASDEEMDKCKLEMRNIQAAIEQKKLGNV